MQAIDILKKYWGYTSFKSKQEEIINSVIHKKDTLALLPTAGGKSICFQLPALLWVAAGPGCEPSNNKHHILSSIQVFFNFEAASACNDIR